MSVRKGKVPTPVARRLRNGLRVVVTPVAGTSTTVRLSVHAGSMFDPKNSCGIGHYLEHMIFKSTDDFSREDIAHATQRMGNPMNAETAKELISVYGTVSERDTDEQIGIIASFLQRPRFDAEEMEVERKVVLEELRDWEDDPSKKIDVLSDATLFGSEHPMGRDGGGRISDVRSITRDQIRRHHRRYFHPENSVLSIVGPYGTREMLAMARAHFGGWRPYADAIMPRHPVMPSIEPAVRCARTATVVRRHNLSQVSFSMSVPVPSYADGHAAMVQTHLAQTLICDGDGSRLWEALRERLGLAYKVDAQLDFYGKAGVMSISSLVVNHRAAAAVKEMRRVLVECSKGRFRKDEFERGKASLAAQIHKGVGDGAAAAERYAEQVALGGDLKTEADDLAVLDSLTLDEFNKFVRANVNFRNATAAAIGSGPALQEIRV